MTSQVDEAIETDELIYMTHLVLMVQLMNHQLNHQLEIKAKCPSVYTLLYCIYHYT